MRKKSKFEDYEPLNRSAVSKASDEVDPHTFQSRAITTEYQSVNHGGAATLAQSSTLRSQPVRDLGSKNSLRRGHALSVLGLFLFTFVLYFRPYELIPALSFLSNIAFWLALFTLIVYVPTQLGLEGLLTVKEREVYLLLMLAVTAILSIPFAVDPLIAWNGVVDYSKVVVIFIVLVNVVRTQKRLKALMWLSILAACISSVTAVNDYTLGNLALGNQRIRGLLGNMFDNPNDLALHLVTMIPIVLGLALGSRAISKKFLCLSMALLFVAGIIATTSRGGLIGLAAVMSVLGWKLARRNRALLGAVGLSLILLIVIFGPGGLKTRIAAGNDGSAMARTDDLKRSIYLSLRHPLVGLGIHNYRLYSNTAHATHNAYTQVSVELGLAALLLYILFLVTPIKRLAAIRQRTSVGGRRTPFEYLSIGLETGIIGYMVTSFFLSVAFQWYAYYLVGYAVVLRRLAEQSEFVRVSSSALPASEAENGRRIQQSMAQDSV